MVPTIKQFDKETSSWLEVCLAKFSNRISMAQTLTKYYSLNFVSVESTVPWLAASILT